MEPLHLSARTIARLKDHKTNDPSVKLAIRTAIPRENNRLLTLVTEKTANNIS